MQSKVLLMAAVISVAGCAGVEVKPMPTPNGKGGFAVSCDGALEDWSSCYKAAANSCQGKYSIIDKQQSATSDKYGSRIYRNLVVECERG
jgi:hypothetical protein